MFLFFQDFITCHGKKYFSTITFESEFAPSIFRTGNMYSIKISFMDITIQLTFCTIFSSLSLLKNPK